MVERSEPQGSAGRGSRWARWLRWAAPRGAGYESTRNLRKWLVLGTAIGIVAGVGAIVFFEGIELATRWLLGGLGGYQPPMPQGEGAGVGHVPTRPWVLPLLTGLGGLVSGALVFGLAPEAEGHGTDAAIEAIHRHGSRIRARIPLVKLVASAITIGTGGSAGREGPAAQISAGFGSLLGRWLKLTPADRRIAVAAGIGAGIGAIFRAPLGGAVLAAEILYVHDIEVEAIVPALVASIVGYTVYGEVLGHGPIFGAHPSLALGSPVQLVYYAGLGLLGGLAGRAYARTFYGTAGAFGRSRLPRWARPVVGGVATGALGMALPQVLHTGYGWVQLAMTREGLLAMPLLVVLLLPLAKIVATSLTIGSGGSGGIFGPGMVIGGMLGALAWRVGEGVLPSLPPDPAPFVIIGMIALFGGIAHAPLAVMLMVAEMTGSLSLLAPAMIAVAVSTAVVGDRTIYRAQLLDRSASPFHRERLSFPVLGALQVRAALEPPAQAPPRGSATDGGSAAADRAPEPLRLDAGLTLFEALARLADAGVSRAAVHDGGDRHLGDVTVRGILRAYGTAVERARRSARLPAGTEVFAVRVGPGSPVAGRTLAEVRLPGEALVVAVARGGALLLPRGSTRLADGDLLTVLTRPGDERALAGYLEGTA